MINNLFISNQAYLLDAIVGLKNIPSNSVDIVIADPPYNVGQNFGNNFDNLALDDYISWCNEWIAEALRVLKDTGTLYIYSSPEVSPYIFTAIETPNKRNLVWFYTNKNSPRNKFWQRSHETIIVIWKNDKRVFNTDLVREEYSQAFLKNAAGKKRKDTDGRFSKKGRTTLYTAHKQGALPRDVIRIPALAGGAGRAERFFYCKNCNDIFASMEKKNHDKHEIIIHPTQKPKALSEKLLTASKPPEDGVVVVPFVGTGVELYVAKTLGMIGYGFDINIDYVRMANILIGRGYPQNLKT